LGLAWAASGRRVAIIDIDPQASLSTWFRLRSARRGKGGTPIEAVAVSGWRVTSEVERQAREHDIVLIDSPPHAETEARIAVRAGKLVLVPVQPSPMDLWATKPILDLARAENTPVLLVLNRVPPRANLTGTVLEAFNALDVPLAEAQIGHRVALAAAINEGKGILEYQPSGAAARDIKALAEEVLRRASI
jgi:chromosome partitioning protein